MPNVPLSRIGISDLYYAMMLTDPVDAPPTYGPVKRLPGLQSAAVARNASTANNYADNKVYEAASQLGDQTLTLGLIDVTPDVAAEWFGLEYKDGALSVGEINPGYMAIMYKYTYSNGTFRYIRHGKAKPTFSDETTNTKGNTITFQNGTYPFALASFSNGDNPEVWIHSDDENLPEAITPAVLEANFFADPLWLPGDGDAAGPEV
ncbi:MAG: hypothetical protein LBR72_05260 [Oscillospiraceae bacterium]|jgi:phi13 family phage major tail protein|nr:hypothetical protein [Oscillospiraceae bacterium]